MMNLDKGDHIRMNKQVITNDGNQLFRIHILMYVNSINSTDSVRHLSKEKGCQNRRVHSNYDSILNLL